MKHLFWIGSLIALLVVAAYADPSLAVSSLGERLLLPDPNSGLPMIVPSTDPNRDPSARVLDSTETPRRDAFVRSTPTPTPVATPAPTPKPSATPIASSATASTTLAAVTNTFQTISPEPTSNPQPKEIPEGTCVADNSLQPYVQSQVNAAANQAEGLARWDNLTFFSDQLRDSINSRRFATGGPVRDIYTNGANQFGKQAALEDYLRGLRPNLEQAISDEANDIADGVVASLAANLDQPFPVQANGTGNATATKPIATWKSVGVRSVDYDLKKRSGGLGITFKTVGHANFKFETGATIQMAPLRYAANYSTCDIVMNGNYSYATQITITPTVRIRYEVVPKGGSGGPTLTGDILLVGPDIPKIVRTIDEKRTR